MKRYNNSGFTMLEILLSVSFLAVLIAVSIPVFQNVKNENDLELGVETVNDSLQRAEMLARAVYRDANWSVLINQNQATVFQGNDFASRDQNFDEFFNLPSSVIVAQPMTVSFSAFTGYPQNPVSIVVQLENGKVHQLDLNSFGLVDY